MRYRLESIGNVMHFYERIGHQVSNGHRCNTTVWENIKKTGSNRKRIGVLLGSENLDVLSREINAPDNSEYCEQDFDTYRELRILLFGIPRAMIIYFLTTKLILITILSFFLLISAEQF